MSYNPAPVPAGPAGGDLSGTYPNPTVTSLHITTAQTLAGQITTKAGGAAATLGANIVSSLAFNNSAEWTITSPGDWTLTGTTAAHVVGNEDPLTATNANAPIVGGTLYQVQVTITGTITAGEFLQPSLGNTLGPSIYGNGTLITTVIAANDTTNFSLTPSTNWNGTVTNVIIKAITPVVPTQILQDSTAVATEEQRIVKQGSASIGIGLNAGRALQSAGISNFYFGQQAGASNTTGANNVGLGAFALGNITTGQGNVAIGLNAMQASVTAANAVAVGSGALQSLMRDGATAIGHNALQSTTNGAGNTAVGISAGMSNTTGTNNTLIGANTDVGANNLTNATAIGYRSAVGSSNCLVLGGVTGANGGISVNVGIGTINPQTALHVVGGLTTGSRTAVADANYSALTTDYLIAYTSLTATRTVTLPTPATSNTGQWYVVKDESGSASALVNITLTPASGTLDGAASLSITSAFGKLRVYSNGSNWFTG